jgi:AraC-like DNA-binding protein
MERRILSRRVHDDGVDRWEMIDAAPAPRLGAFVDRYSDYREATTSFTARRELAATSGVLIYVLGEPLEVVGADGQSVTVSDGEAFVGGIADATSITRAYGAQAGIHVFLPLRSLALVAGVPVSEIANRVVPLRDLIGGSADDLGGRLCEASSPETRFGLLDEFIARRFAEGGAPDPMIDHALCRLAGECAPRVERLADEYGWSRRHFTRRFCDAVGLPPDRFRRLARFEHFVRRLTEAPDDSFAGLAAECGYVDQAHLHRNVRDFAAMTPGELRKRLIPHGGGVRED